MGQGAHYSCNITPVYELCGSTLGPLGRPYTGAGILQVQLSPFLERHRRGS
jgi:hypothetical protein